MNDSRATIQPSAETAAEAVRRHVETGDLLARWGKWGQAAKEGLELVEANPGDRFTWARTVPRVVLAGDVEAYRRLCGRMVEQFAMSSEEQADTVCKLCSLLPDCVERAKLPLAVLTVAIEKGPAQPGFESWYHACLGLCAYRDGHFAESADWSKKACENFGKEGPGAALALAVLALAQEQSQQTDEARQSLAECTALIPPELATLGSPEFEGSLPVSEDTIYPDWLMAEILRREAKRLIEP